MDLDALSAPLPRERRDRRLSLDGTWELELGGETLPIEVPFTFEAPLSGIGRGDQVHERVRYRRSFRVPADWRGLHVLLRFGGVDWSAAVAVDGHAVGRHTGGYTHFSFDLGELDPAARHEIVVDVHDPADGPQPRGKQRGSGGIWYTRATGIWRSVWLEAVPRAHITAFTLEVTAGGVVHHEVETSEPTEVTVHVAHDTGAIPRWSPESPHLVDVELRTTSGDHVRSYVAFRTVERDGRDILLNGERRFLCGVLDQAYWPAGVYTAPSFEALFVDVQAAKDLGFHLARMHVKVADPRWYALCDALGVLVAQDLPSPLRLDTEEARANFTREAEEIVEQLRGHPCICMWIAINEAWGEPGAEYQLGLARRLRELDPSRLVIDASGWTQRGETDLVDVHDYGDDLSAHASGALPLWVGECGGVSLVVGGDEDFAYKHVGSAEELAAAVARLLDSLGDVAGFVWTQLTDVEGELNGLLTAERRPKADPAAIRSALDAVRARHLTDR